MVKQYDLEHYLRQLRKIEEHREANCEKEVKKIYEELLRDLNGFLGDTYADLAVDDKLTYEILHSKGKYARFLEEVEKKVNNITPRAAKQIKKTVQDTYKAAYEGMAAAVTSSKTYEKLKTNLKGLSSVTPDVMKRAVENPISGLTLNDTLEKNRQTVIYDIKQSIGVGLSQGDRMSTMARRITEKVDMDYRKAIRIVRTETHRVREAGYQDASERISQRLRDDDSDYVMTKTWKTMQDEAVRPQRPAYRRKKGVKARKAATAGLRSSLSGPNHMKMHGVTVLVDEEFDLGNGVTAMAPGQSGVAGHDINCRCYLSRDLMTKAEFAKLTGRKFEQTEAEKIAQEEQKLIDEQKQLEQDRVTAEQELKKLEQKIFDVDGFETSAKDYMYDTDMYDALRNIDAQIFDVTDKNEIDKLLASINVDDASERAKILGSYFETELGGDAARRYGLTTDYMLKYESKDFDTLEKHVRNMTSRLHADIQPELDDINKFVEAGQRYAQLQSQIGQINNDLASITDELKVLKIKKYEAKGITVDDLFDDVQKRKKEIEELSKQVKGVKSLKNITFRSDTALDYINDPFTKEKLDVAFDYLEHTKARRGLDSFEQDEYDALKKFFDDIADAQNSDVDVDGIKELIKAKKDELKILEADLSEFVDVKAKAMQKELIENVDSQIDELKAAMKNHTTGFGNTTVEQYVENERVKQKITKLHDDYEKEIAKLKKEDEFAKSCITIGNRPEGISAAQYLDDKGVKRFVDDEWNHLQKAHKNGTLKDWEVERYDNYKKFFDDIDEYTKTDTIAIELKNVRKEKRLLEDFMVEADDYADKLKKLEKEKEKVTGEVERFKAKYNDGEIPRSSSAKVLDKLQEYADKKVVYDRQLKAIASDLGVATDEAREMLSETLTEIADECDIGIKIRSDSLEKVLDSGEFKNLFETGTGGGCTNQAVRRRGEDEVFGFAADALDEDRPIYGMMIPSLDASKDRKAIDYITTGPGGHYGNGVTVVVNKNKVRHNTSFTIGDSLDCRGEVNGSLFDDPIFNGGWWGFEDRVDKLLNPSSSANDRLIDAFEYRYLEIQIHGKENHSADIIEKVYFTKLAGDRAKKTGLLDKLTAHGIPYEILD